MNTAAAKILLAFAGGAAITSGLFVWLGREAPRAAAPQPAPVAEVPAPVVIEAPVPPPAPAAPAKPEPVKRASTAKPKPQPKPVEVAAAPRQPERPAPPVTQPQAPEPALEPVAAATPAPSVEEPSAPAPIASLPRPVQSVTLKEGTLLSVRLGEGLSSERNAPGDTFRASLDEPLVIDGWVIAERGARVLGRVRDSETSGRVKGLASLTLELVSLDTADGQRLDLRTAGFVHKARESKKNDAVKVGIGAAIGAALGAAIGGGKGAAIGAASGGAAGAGAVIATKGDAAALDPETRIRFRIDRSVEITERR